MSFLVCLLIVLVCIFILRKRYLYKIEQPNEQWILNMISQRTFNPVIDHSLDTFLKELLKHQVLYYKDFEWYFNDGRSKLILFVDKNVVSLYHVQLDAYVMCSKNISHRTLKCIKNAQKKLTTEVINS